MKTKIKEMFKNLNIFNGETDINNTTLILVIIGVLLLLAGMTFLCYHLLIYFVDYLNELFDNGYRKSLITLLAYLIFSKILDLLSKFINYFTKKDEKNESSNQDN